MLINADYWKLSTEHRTQRRWNRQWEYPTVRIEIIELLFHRIFQILEFFPFPSRFLFRYICSFLLIVMARKFGDSMKNDLKRRDGGFFRKESEGYTDGYTVVVNGVIKRNSTVTRRCVQGVAKRLRRDRRRFYRSQGNLLEEVLLRRAGVSVCTIANKFQQLWSSSRLLSFSTTTFSSHPSPNANWVCAHFRRSRNKIYPQRIN